MPAAASSAAPRGASQPGFPIALWALWAYLLVAIGRLAEIVPGMEKAPLAKIAVGACLLGLLVGRGSWSKRPVLSQPIPRSAFALFVLSGASVVFSVWKSETLSYFFSSAMVVAIGFVLTVKICSSRRRLIATLYVLVLIALAQAVAALATRKGRISAGESYDPNDLAYLLVTVLPLALAFVVSASTTFRRGCAIALSAVFVIAILLTQSRGGLLAMVALVVYLMFFPLTTASATPTRRARYRLPARVALVVLAGWASWGALPDTTRERLATVFSLENDYNTDTTLVSGRMAIWERNTKSALQRPIGYGLASFGVVDMQTGGVYKTAHNSILLALVELGFVGCFLFLRIYWLAWRSLGLPIPDDPEAAIFCRALKASLIANFVSGFFLSETYSSLIWTLFALITLAVGTITLLPGATGTAPDQLAMKGVP